MKDFPIGMFPGFSCILSPKNVIEYASEYTCELRSKTATDECLHDCH